MTLIQYPQQNDNDTLAEQILALEKTAWQIVAEEKFPSAPDTHATSFVLFDGETAVCHVGIRRSLLSHKGKDYIAYGLSEVVTRPQYRRKGLASRVIRSALQYIMEQQPDLSIFTCAADRVDFYEKCGWKAERSVSFVGGTTEKPFRSDSLGLITMLLLISPKAKQHQSDFQNTDVIFELGEGQLW